MSYILDHQGKPYLRFFEDIASIPHCSFNEEAIGSYVMNFAKKRNLWCERDNIGNVLIKKPGTKNYEDHEPIALQGHMDMVCEKKPGSTFNFDTDSLQLYVENGWLRAKETTLGADDGVAIAYMLAILDEPDLQHPPLECIFTVQEEVGVYGATGFDCSKLKARKMIGLDGTTEGSTTVLTSGVIGGDFKLDIHKEVNMNPVYEIKVTGLSGGHGAGNIGKEQGNAIKIASRILYYMKKEFELRIVKIEGGTIRNGIAEECFVSFATKQEFQKKAEGIVSSVYADVRIEHEHSDADLNVSFNMGKASEEALDQNSSNNLIDFLQVLPSGTYMRSLVYSDLPIASRNLGTINQSQNIMEIGYIFRANRSSMLDYLFESGQLLAKKYNGVFETLYKYPGYNIEPGKPMFNLWNKVYKEASGRDIQIEAAHYGTDTGTFVERIPDLDVIILSPNIEYVHTPNERLELSSFHRVYEYLKEILRRS